MERMDSESTTLAALTSVDKAMPKRSPNLKAEQSEGDIEARAERMHGLSASVPTRNEAQGTRIGPRVISDAILGLSDGLTVPFALTAGLSTFGDAKLVVLGGLAELIAGAISMGLGGFVGAKSEA